MAPGCLLHDLRDVAGFLWSFSPFIVFGLVAGPGPWRLPVSLGAALVLLFVSGGRQLRCGFVLPWGGLAFFVGALLALVAGSQWFLARLGIFAQATLAAIAIVSLLARRPFVLQYARQGADPARVASPSFVRGCYLITAFWAAMFLISLAVAIAKFLRLGLPETLAHALSLGAMIVGIVFTQGYKHWVAAKSAAAARQAGPR